MRHIIITSLLAFFCIAGQAQEKITVPKDFADTYWRNEKTGDWEIGFTDSCTIYDCQLWTYGSVREKGDKLFLTLDNGNKTVNVTIGKQKDGKCQMTIGKKKQTYSNITTWTLPPYPKKDNKPFKDNGFREGDSATLIGWLKDCPVLKGKNRQLEGSIGGFVIPEPKVFVEEFDADGHFAVKIPLENTQRVELWMKDNPWRVDALLEPGDVCFVLYDEKADKHLYMGKNARISNELEKRHFWDVDVPNPDEGVLSEEQIQTYLCQYKEGYRQNMAKVDSFLTANPTYSRKFEDFYRMKYVCRLADEITQIDAQSDFRVPRAEIDTLLVELKKEIRKPYTLSEDIISFLYRYESRCIHTAVETQSHSLAHALEGKTGEQYEAEWLKWQFGVMDSILTDSILRECAKAERIYVELLMREQPLKQYLLDAAQKIQLPAARNRILAKNQAMIAMQDKPYTFTGLRPSSDVADITDGEKVLRKILEPYKGKLVLMDIWGTWCAPCKEALSHSKEEYERLKDYDLVYLYLANGSPDESWKNVIKKYDVAGDNVVHYNLPAEQQSAIEEYIGVTGFPTYKLIDRDGTILDEKVDARDLENLERILKKLQKK